MAWYMTMNAEAVFDAAPRHLMTMLRSALAILFIAQDAGAQGVERSGRKLSNPHAPLATQPACTTRRESATRKRGRNLRRADSAGLLKSR